MRFAFVVFAVALLHLTGRHWGIEPIEATDIPMLIIAMALCLAQDVGEIFR